ncbi:family 78 glycoside hydrolase catalytic domain [Phytohabitans sp. ZYX-F-186]|uniref:alpha-L-rhamnosidase n=1 Tax=Phytohabitans maris TaxID=3071409 RepID=A0ABU0ZDH9_9ACTN|nr:family 78 glycoside hydrolase catalytic domain [Phytohabitans sp. ZYX-F-186]MDQ7905104.1 family 78 glycoside hydrolase catalytic domain [Phytohabitans sp. ZYX-F-186]
MPASAWSGRSLPLVIIICLLASQIGVQSAGAHVPAVTAGPAVLLSHLQVERKTEPVGIDVERPRFSWVTESDRRGVEQASWRVRVATSPSRLNAGDLVWDSGTTASDRSVDVTYAGPDLAPATDYVWRVDTRTNVGSASATSRFRTGLYDERDWAGSAWIGNARTEDTDQLDLGAAAWIWTPEATTPVAPAEPRAFRTVRTSPAGKTARTAEILITGDDLYRLWVNGTLLGETQGAENEWQQSRLFRVDLAPERNVFAVRTDNGAGSPAGLVAKVRITYTDGSTTVFATGTDWKASKTVPAGFEAPSYDDSAWGNAVVQAPYGQGPWGSNVRPPRADVRPAPLLRKEFAVDGKLIDATLYYAAGGYAEVFLNGDRVTDGVLSPGFTDYDDTVQYAAVDVTDHLERGDNAIGMELGRGFYGMTGGNVWRWDSPPWHDDPVVRAVLHLEYADGSTQDVVTDDSWTVADGPTVFDDLYAGETYDAGKLQDGYDTVGFDDRAWAAASEVRGPKGVLVHQRQQPIRVTGSLPAVEITQPVSGVWVVKFPRVLAGWVEFTAQGPAGTTIRAQYGEKLLPNGRVNFSNNGGFQSGFQTDRFILAGTGAPESWQARFSYKGFQYIEVTGWPGGQPPPDAFTAKAVHTDAAETGSFESANATMNEVHRAVVNTMKNNIHGIPTDTPMFEKNGWTGDASVGAEMFMLNLDVHELFAKWMRDVHETRDENGAPLVIAPSSGDWGQWGVNPPWHSAYVMIPWWLYQYGGDDRVLTELYDGMKRYVELEFNRSSNGIVANPRLGDWVSPEASPAGGNAPEDVRVSGTAYLYAMLTAMERSARHLGRAADAAAFAGHAATVKATFNDTFLNRADGFYRGNGDRGYRQTHNVLALAFGLAPDEGTAKRVADSVVADIRAKGMHLNTGVLGTKYLLPVLTDAGYADVALQLAQQTTYPSWGYMVENGATTMWEHWALEARSRGHYFLGTVDDWYFHDVAGIQASAETGYDDLTIAPKVTKQLAWAKATTQTPYGPVTSDWKRTGRTLTLRATVPVGARATVELPARNAWAVTERGVPVADADGVRNVRHSGGTVQVEVGSGHYTFVVDERRGLAGAAIDRTDELTTLVQELRAAGKLNAGQARKLHGYSAAARAHTRASLDELLHSDVLGAARDLAAAHRQIEAFDAAARHQALSLTDRARLAAAVLAVRDALGVAVADLLTLDLTAAPPDAVLRPGDTAAVTVRMANGGAGRLNNVRATITGLPDGWTATPGSARLTNQLRPGHSAAKGFSIHVPYRQKPGPAAGTAVAVYVFDDATLTLAKPFELTVDSPAVVDSVTAAPAETRPGQPVTVRAVIRNVGRAAVAGRVELDLPPGWSAPAPTATTIPPGQTHTATFTVAVPRDARQAVEDVPLTARFVSDGETLATGAGTVRVAIAPNVDDAIDHVDLGLATSEQTHNLTASPSSGASTEAGLTRRYAGHLTPFSQFEFDMAVTPGQPFVVRAIETYDKAQVKRYKIYVDGTEVLLRTFDHAGGTGTETYEFVVPASLAATDDTIRIRFEHQGDPAYYDPSIADVWTRPLS